MIYTQFTLAARVPWTPFQPKDFFAVSTSQVIVLSFWAVLQMWHKSLPSTARTAIIWETFANLMRPASSIFWAKQKWFHTLRMMLSIWAYLAETSGTRERNHDGSEDTGRLKFRIHLCPFETLHKSWNSAFQVFSVKWEQCGSTSQMEGDATARTSSSGSCCTNGDNDYYREVL